MGIKRLRSGKNIESKTMADFSSAANKQLFDEVRSQMIETMKLPAKYSGITDNITSSGYLILRTGHRLCEYCKIVSGEYFLENRKRELCEIISFICEKSEPFFERKDMTLCFRHPPERIFVNIDEEKFCYALLELLVNAAKNSFRGSKVKVFVSATKKYAKITVSDRGKGMDEETLEHCFEPFYCAADGNNEANIGIGLSLAFHFVSESGGRMKIVSEKGKGTEISMLLPLAERNDSELCAEVPPAEILGGIFSPVYIMLSDIGKEE